MRSRSEQISIALISQDIEYIKKNLQKISDQLEEDYIRKSDFEPVKRIVYGLVAIILTTFIGAVAGLVFLR